MKRILLSLSVVALLSTAGGIFAEGTNDPTTNTATPNTTTTDNNSGNSDPVGAPTSPNTTAPDANPALTGNNTVQVKVLGMSSTDTTPLNVTVDNVPVSVSSTAPGTVSLPAGTEAKKLVVVINAPNGTPSKCTNIKVLKSKEGQASATAPISQVLFRVHKDRNGNLRCESVQVQTGGWGASM
jgi:hypothetical protein